MEKDVIFDISGTDNILLKKVCPYCKCENRMCVDGYGYEKYVSTKMAISEVFRELSRFEREFIMTGYCVKCQEKIFRRKAKPEDMQSFC